MGRQLKQYDKDYMKMAMLKQEETFRQQVHELHRLYRVQKLLMNDVKAEVKRQRKNSGQVLNLELPAEEYIGKDNQEAEEENENELELTLATGSSCCRRRKKESSYTSDSGGASFSSSSAESGSVKVNGRDWGLFRVPDIKFDSYHHREMKGKFNVDEQMNEERANRPPWLFQCLSLNMT